MDSSERLFLSIVEDILTLGLTALAAFHPVAILAIILVFILLLLWLGPKVFRAIRRMLWQVGAILGGTLTPTSSQKQQMTRP
jgi:hypothetical protein